MQSQTATADQWRHFLRPLVFAVSNPPAMEDFDGRCAAIAAAIEAPAHMLTEWRQRDAMRRFKFFPSVAEVQEWLAPDLRDERETQHLRLPRPAPEPERGPRSMDEILAVRAKAAEARAALRAAEEPPEMKPVQPRYLSPGQLLHVYERLAKEGNQAAATRAAAIRKQIEAAA